MNSGSSAFRLKQSEISFENVRISRDEGVATGAFALNLRSGKLDQLQVQAHLQPAAMAAWFEPSLLPLIDYFSFSQPPDLTVESTERNGRTRLEMHVDATSELVYRCGLLDVPLVSATVDLRQSTDEVSLSIPNARVGDGQCSINARLRGPNSTVESELAFDRVSLLSLRSRSEFLSDWRGELSGLLKIGFAAGDSSRDRIEGKLVLKNTNFSKPHLLEPGFKKLASAGFSQVGQLQVAFVAELGLVKIGQLTLVSAHHVVDLSGTLDLASGAVQLSGHLDHGAAMARVAGVMTDPDWEIVLPHRD